MIEEYEELNNNFWKNPNSTDRIDYRFDVG